MSPLRRARCSRVSDHMPAQASASRSSFSGLNRRSKLHLNTSLSFSSDACLHSGCRNSTPPGWSGTGTASCWSISSSGNSELFLPRAVELESAPVAAGYHLEAAVLLRCFRYRYPIGSRRRGIHRPRHTSRPYCRPVAIRRVHPCSIFVDTVSPYDTITLI